MQKAKGNHHKMSKTPEGRPDVENNSEKPPSVLRRLGRVAAKAAGAVKRTWRTMIGRDSDEYAVNDSLAPEVSEPSKPTLDDIARNKQKDKARDAAATEDTLEGETSSVDEPEVEGKNTSTPEKPVDVSENESKYYSLDDLIYGDVPKSKADKILKNAYGTAHEPKTLDELIDNPNISKEEADEILDRVYGSSSEKNDRKDDVNSAKSGQESGAAELSKDEQVKDSNSNTGEARLQ